MMGYSSSEQITIKKKTMNTLNKKQYTPVLIIALTVICSSLQVMGQEAKRFLIKGKLEGFNTISDKIYLIYDPMYKKPTDSAQVINNRYQFMGTIDYSAQGTLSFNKKVTQVSPGFSFMLDGGEIDLLSINSLSATTISGTGGAAQKEIATLAAEPRRESLLLAEMAKAPGYSTNDSLKKVVKERSTKLFLNALSNTITYIREHPQSSVSPYLTYSLLNSGMLTDDMTDTLLSIFPKHLKTSTLKLEIDKLMQQKSEAREKFAASQKAKLDRIPLGITAPDFSMPDPTGKLVTLSSLKGKYILLDFWASWCKPCREENPTLVEAYKRYQKKGFEILGVSLDGATQKQAWIKAIEQDGLTWTQLSDLKGFQSVAGLLYQITSIPQNFLIDPEGKIVAKNLRGDQLKIKLSEIFAEQAPQ